MNKNLASISLAALLALLVSTPRSAAVPNIQNSVGILENTSAGGQSTAGGHNYGLPGSPLPDFYTYSGPTVSVDTSANYGLLQSSVFVNVTSSSNPRTFQYGIGDVNQRATDIVTISAPGLDGQAGTLNVRTFFSAHVSETAPRSFKLLYELGFRDNPQTGLDYGYTGLLPLAIDDQPVTASTSFTFGVPFSLYMFTQLMGSGSVTDGNSQFFDGDVTARWDSAFTSVLDGSSAPVSNFTMTSESGFNYAQPVPEPSSWPAVCGGSALLLGFRRHRARLA